MDRRERDRYDNRNHEGTYDRYDGYSRQDSQYHSARNLTDSFERDYQRERGHSDGGQSRYPINRSYHEGDMGDAYEQNSRRSRDLRGYSDNQRYDRDQDRNFSGNYNRDRYNDNQDNFSRGQATYGRSLRQGQGYGNRQQNTGSSDRYNTFSDYDRQGSGSRQGYYAGSRDTDSYSRSGDTDRNSRYDKNTYEGGTSYSGNYGAGEHDRYSRSRGGRDEDRWFDQDRQRRDY